jgi:hypothetical protein
MLCARAAVMSERASHDAVDGAVRLFLALR